MVGAPLCQDGATPAEGAPFLQDHQPLRPPPAPGRTIPSSHHLFPFSPRLLPSPLHLPSSPAIIPSSPPLASSPPLLSSPHPLPSCPPLLSWSHLLVRRKPGSLQRVMLHDAVDAPDLPATTAMSHQGSCSATRVSRGGVARPAAATPPPLTCSSSSSHLPLLMGTSQLLGVRQLRREERCCFVLASVY